MLIFGHPPEWLMGPASEVLEDLQGAQPIVGLLILATVMDDNFNGLSLGLVEPSASPEELIVLPDELDAELPLVQAVGGNWVPRTMTGAHLLVHVADLLQEDLAETEAAWGEARPPCPRHPHPARPAIRDGEAWWICSLDDELLYRIGQGEVPTRLQPRPAWHPTETNRARKRRRR